MVTYNCDCKNIVITEGIFGEIYDYPGANVRRYNYDKYFGEKLFSDADSKEALSGSKPILVKSYTMTNKNCIEIIIIEWGATIVSIKFPDKYGHIADVVLGFDDLKSYMNSKINPFIGCILGRCANRIKNGYIIINGKNYQLTLNDLNEHHLHGGMNGFGRRLWESRIDGCSVIMSYLSKDGEEGYPGAVLSTVKFKLTPDNKLEIGIRATTTCSTIVNISHGSLFNLAGHNAGKKELLKHKVSLNCDRWTFADYTEPVPTGSIRGVGGTIMDLRIPKYLEDCIEKVPPGEGYDHNFCVTQNWHGGIGYVAQVVHPTSGRALEVYSNQPGVQFYTGGRLSTCINAPPTYDLMTDSNITRTEDDSQDHEGEYDEEEKEVPAIEQITQNVTSQRKSSEFILGKKGARYVKHCAFSIQPQNYPNFINYSHFPSSILHPGEIYCHDITYKFGIQLANYM